MAPVRAAKATHTDAVALDSTNPDAPIVCSICQQTFSKRDVRLYLFFSIVRPKAQLASVSQHLVRHQRSRKPYDAAVVMLLISDLRYWRKAL